MLHPLAVVRNTTEPATSSWLPTTDRRALPRFWRRCVLQERNVVDVAKDVAKLFDLPDSKITYVKDRAFNDQCASLQPLRACRLEMGIGMKVARLNCLAAACPKSLCCL